MKTNKASSSKLAPMQELFVREYLCDLNATQAAIRAGYSEKTAEQQGPRLLGNVGVAAAIQAGMQKRAERTGITQDRVLQEVARIGFFDVRKLFKPDGSLKAPHKLDDEAAAAISSIDVVEMEGGAQVGGEDGTKHVAMYTKKVKLFDKLAALTLLMRHLGMLNDKLQLDGGMTVTVKDYTGRKKPNGDD